MIPILMVKILRLQTSPQPPDAVPLQRSQRRIAAGRLRGGLLVGS